MVPWVCLHGHVRDVPSSAMPNICSLASTLLGNFIWARRDEFQDQHVLELGAGTGLPGLVAATVGSRVTLTDCRSQSVLNNCKSSVSLNRLQDRCQVVHDSKEKCWVIKHNCIARSV
jgi:tRNA1(Val) A37 N6-methylase TrmN6